MSRRIRRSWPAGASSASRDTGAGIDNQGQPTESFPAVDARQVIGTLPPVLALSATGRVATSFARLEHLHQWAALEEDNFTTAEKAALLEAVTPFMDETTLLGDGIAGYQAAHPEAGR